MNKQSLNTSSRAAAVGDKNKAVFIITALIFLISLSICLIGFLATYDSFFQSIWTDRDLWRGLHFDPLTTITGPESDTGVRAPGGAFYALIKLSFLIDQSPAFANLFRLALLVASVLIFFVYLTRRFKIETAALATLLYASSNLILSNAAFWNPGYIPLFAVLMFVCAHSYIVERKTSAFFFFFFLFSFSSQIHQQTTLLLIGFLVAVIFNRPWPSLRHWGAGALGLIVPLAPYIVDESLSGFPRTASMILRFVSSGYVGGSSFASSWEKFAILQAFVSNSAYPFAELGGATTLVSRFFLKPLDMLVIGATGLFLFLFLAQKIATLRSGASRKVTPEISVVLATLAVALLWLLKSEHFLPRHQVALAPYISLFSALAMVEIVKFFPSVRTNFANQLTPAVLIILFSGRCLFVGAIALFSSVSITQIRYHGLVEISQVFSAQYGWGFDEVQTYGASATVSGGAATFHQLSFGSYFDILELHPVTPASDVCVVVLAKLETAGQSMHDLQALLLANPEFARFQPHFTGLNSSEHFWFVEYQGQDGNCLKSLTNPYLDMAFDRWLVKRSVPPDGLLSEPIEWLPNEAAPPSGVGFTIQPKNGRAPYGLLLAPGAEGVTPILVGRETRGYTGVKVVTLSDSVVRFINDEEGEIVSRSFVPNLGGGQKAGAVTPWRLGVAPLKPGRWTVRFSGRRDGAPFDLNLGDIFVTEQKGALILHHPASGLISPKETTLGAAN